MAKKKYSFDEKTLKKRLKEGRGSGFLNHYKPWIYVHEIPSIGKSSIKQGWKTGRDHHLLSTLETKYFYTLEWKDEVCDIREQFPLLPRSETQDIAKELGIEHPKDRKTQTDTVITSDFVETHKIEYSTSIRAVSIKYDVALEDHRTKEKLLIEKIYWQRRGVEWKIATENSINHILVWNIEWLYKNYSLQGHFYGISQDKLMQLDVLLLELVRSLRTPLISITNHTDQLLNLPVGTSMAMVKHQIAKKKINVDMTTKKINTSKPLPILLV